jgi:hypothetical protein
MSGGGGGGGGGGWAISSYGNITQAELALHARNESRIDCACLFVNGSNILLASHGGMHVSQTSSRPSITPPTGHHGRLAHDSPTT